MQRFLIFTSFLFLFIATSTTQAIPTPAPPSIAGSGHLLIDFHSGHIISQENANQRLEPASITKLMTAYVVFTELAQGNLNLNDDLPCLCQITFKSFKFPLNFSNGFLLCLILRD